MRNLKGFNPAFLLSVFKKVAIGCSQCRQWWDCSVEHATLVRGDHVLDVDESVVAAVHLEKLERFLNEVAEVLLLALRVVDAVAHVDVLLLEEVHDGEDLTVIGHKGLTDGVAALDEGLKDVERGGDDRGVTRVQSRCDRLKVNDFFQISLTLDRDDQLGNDGEDLGLTVVEKVKNALAREEAVRLLLLTDALHEDGQVVMVVELLNFNLPGNSVRRAVLDLDRQISAVVETTELGRRDGSLLDGSSLGLLGSGPLDGLVQGGGVATTALTALGVLYTIK